MEIIMGLLYGIASIFVFIFKVIIGVIKEVYITRNGKLNWFMVVSTLICICIIAGFVSK